MAIVAYDPFDDHDSHLKSLPDSLLRDIARNEAAEHRYRLAAVEVLIARKSPTVKHPDLQQLVHELEIELEDIQFEHPAPSGTGPLVASVTTETMFGGESETQTDVSMPQEIDNPNEQQEPDAKKSTRRNSKKATPPSSE